MGTVSARQRRAAGFTLLELLLVMVIAGITLGMVTLSGLPNERQALHGDAQRIALLLQLARDEAIVRNRPIAFETDGNSYRFLIREGEGWEPLAEDELLRAREFKRAPVAIALAPDIAVQRDPLRLVFGREPVDKPFQMMLSLGDTSVAIQADGIGHFRVQ